MPGWYRTGTIDVRNASAATGLSWTRSGATITVTHNSHGIANQAWVHISASSDIGTIPSGSYQTTYIGANSYSIQAVNTGAASGTLTANSGRIVAGSGTTFTDNALSGEAFVGPDTNIYEITSVNSATSLTLATNYTGSTLTGQTYAILPTHTFTKDLASEVSTLVGDYQTSKSDFDAGSFSKGTTAAPGINFGVNGQSNTGFTNETTGEIGISIAGTNRGKITATGINDTAIGATTAAPGTFTNLTATGTVTLTGATVANLGSVTTADINGGTIDGTTIGATTRAAGNFTTLDANGNVTLGDASTDTVTVNGRIGVGGGSSATTPFYVSGSLAAGSGVTQIGVYSSLTGTTEGTYGIYSFYSLPRTPAAAYTVSYVAGSVLGDAVKGAGSTITNQHGVYVSDQTQGTNNYGITSLVSSGTNKWNIYASGTAANYFAGNVGIGTSSPTVALQVGATNSVDRTLQIGSAGATRAVLSTMATSGLLKIGCTNDASAGSIAFLTGGSLAERMRIDDLGNVGIGTSTPAASLDVWSYSDLAAYTPSSTTLPVPGVVSSSSYRGTTTNAPVFHTFYDSPSSSIWYHGSTGGTTLSTSAAYVIGNRTGTTSYAERFRIDSAGNVGIGTSSPLRRLTARATGSNLVGRFESDQTSTWIQFSANSTGTASRIGCPTDDSSASIALMTADVARLRIDSVGNIGIGAVPSALWGTYHKAIVMSSSSASHIATHVNNLALGVGYVSSNIGDTYTYATQAATKLYLAPTYVSLSMSPAAVSAGDSVPYTQVLGIEKDKSIAIQGATSQTGAGISFPATQSASTDANTLDDYEEGTFTPTLLIASGDLSVTYTTQTGRYTKIGNVCYFTLTIVTSSFTHTTGTTLIVGALPFSQAASQKVHLSAMINYTKANYTSVNGGIDPSLYSGNIFFRLIGSGQYETYLTRAELPSGTNLTLTVSGHYYV